MSIQPLILVVAWVRRLSKAIWNAFKNAFRWHGPPLAALPGRVQAPQRHVDACEGGGLVCVSPRRGRGRSRCSDCLALENLALPARQCFGPPGLKGQEDSGLGELSCGQVQRAALRLYAGSGPRGRLAEGGPVSDTHHTAGTDRTWTCVIRTGARRGRADARVPAARGPSSAVLRPRSCAG